MNGRRTAGEAQPAPGPEMRRGRGPGWIWAVPIAAAALLLWLGLRFWVTQGATAVVRFDQAAQVETHSTKVTYRGVKIGEVSDVSLSDDGLHARVELSLDRSVRKYLRSGTRFWLQGSAGSITDLAGLKSVISGPSIIMQPGPGEPRREFDGLDEPPPFAEPVQGRRFTLLAARGGSLRPGSDVYYLGLKVGKVTDFQFSPPHGFRYEVLIRSPYDGLVHPGSRFWDASALQISFGNGLDARLLSPAALFSGAVAFDTPAAAAAQPPSGEGAAFSLYRDRSSAELAPQPAGALYRVDFPGDVGGLKPGAEVSLRGFTVGVVRSVDFRYDVASGRLLAPVRLELDAGRFHLDDGGRLSEGDRVQALRSAMAEMVRRGLRARLQRQPPLLGSYGVVLDFVPHAAPPPAREDGEPTIPSAPGGGLGDKLDHLPVQEIGENLRAITARFRALAASPHLDDSLLHLDRALARIDRITAEAAPQIGPLVANLRQASTQIEQAATAAHQVLGGADRQEGLDRTVQELDRAARSVRSLADYLDRHPEALLRGRPQ